MKDAVALILKFKKLVFDCQFRILCLLCFALLRWALLGSAALRSACFDLLRFSRLSRAELRLL
jgi:hypothetical protein